ncbi:MAG: type II toxin-antitoxin system Phd/YefM family antitoxin [Pseudomonadales bacterium]|nr:type II toxin-antitoxin system Phd/YefM family antitoxin [Candidatus Woesebacteria bacterium]MCB9801995.1 type II toxin-antitoxin system Phd/YefM family antitoxin [Pseudomonadales bacterium]
MNVITATTLRNNFSDSMQQVADAKDYLLVAKRGKIQSAVVNIELFEELLDLRDSSYLKSIQKARKEYETGDALSHDEVFGEL